MIDKAQLKMDTGIKVIEEIAPVFKDRIFVLVLSQLVVDVIKAEEKRRQKKLSVQQSIAYKEMGKDGICRVQGKTYSKCIRFYDINYQLASK